MFRLTASDIMDWRIKISKRSVTGAHPRTWNSWLAAVCSFVTVRRWCFQFVECKCIPKRRILSAMGRRTGWLIVAHIWDSTADRYASCIDVLISKIFSPASLKESLAAFKKRVTSYTCLYLGDALVLELFMLKLELPKAPKTKESIFRHSSQSQLPTQMKLKESELLSYYRTLDNFPF